MSGRESFGTQKLKQSQKLSAHQVQLMSMVTMPITDLSQRIKRELEENPALEEGSDHPEELSNNEETNISESDLVLGDYASEDDVPDTTLNKYAKYSTPASEIPFAEEPTLQETLLDQLPLTSLDEDDQSIAQFIIGSIDNDGYLRRTREGLIDDLAIYRGVSITPQKLEEILKVLRTLDPAGVFASDLRECLLLQLQRNPAHPSIQLATEILTDHFEDFAKRRYEQLTSTLHVSDEELREAINLITSLNPTPGRDFENKLTETLQTVVPDFEVTEQDGDLKVTLYFGDIPQVRLNRTFQENMQDYTGDLRKLPKNERETARFVREKIDQAKTFVQMLKLRENALMNTMMTIVDLQREFFLTGDIRCLRPMILKDIADRTGYDISTISRVTSTKYVATDYGTYPLKYFFADATITDTGEEISTHHVRELITEIIDNEDKRSPLSDEAIRAELKKEGITVARRTVAKYRDQLGLPIARLRKEI